MGALNHPSKMVKQEKYQEQCELDYLVQAIQTLDN